MGQLAFAVLTGLRSWRHGGRRMSYLYNIAYMIPKIQSWEFLRRASMVPSRMAPTRHSFSVVGIAANTATPMFYLLRLGLSGFHRYRRRAESGEQHVCLFDAKGFYIRAKKSVDELGRQGLTETRASPVLPIYSDWFRNPHLVMAFVGNKVDLGAKRKIDTHEALQYAEQPLLPRDVDEDGAERQRALLRARLNIRGVLGLVLAAAS